jgi:hypothetical protein
MRTMLRRYKIATRHESAIESFPVKSTGSSGINTAARTQRSHCRNAIAVVASVPQTLISHNTAANNQPHQNPMKQFPTTQQAPKTRQAAAVSLRAEFAELLS